MQDLTEAYFSIYENHDDLSEATRRTEYLQKKFNKQNKQNPGSAHKYIPGKQNTGSALQKARESERHMSGDFNEERFPLKNKKGTVKMIRDLRKTIEAEIAKTSQTRSARKPEQQGGRKPTTNLDNVRIGESHDFYDLVLDYLLDEGYADTEENAISMMSAMSEDWIDSIVEAFVDPENDEAPSGRTPMQNIEDKSDKVRKKAIGGFEKQMGKEYGGKWKYQER